jgi:hypothetical protein
MNGEVPKPIKRALRELLGCAHEEALRWALTDLKQEFDRWERGEVDSFELEQQIHKFDRGPAREIYVPFAMNRLLQLPVAAAIHEGLIDEESVPAEVMPYLETALSLYRESR